jgi:hypothetical protein
MGHSGVMRENCLLSGRYRLVERLGNGGMSEVWRGLDEVLGRQVAVKVLASGPAASATLRERLRTEAQAAARLSHPHITNVYDYGETSGDGGPPLPYVVMELVEGEALAARLAGGAALPWRTVLAICAEVAAALASAHARGIVHRDVTPGNVMLTSAGAKVVDFGISALIGEDEVGEDGSLLGTPAYLAPERLDGGPVSPATDVYALGLLLYRSLSGRLPWQAATTTQMLRAHRYVQAGPPPVPADAPDEVAELCHRCLAKSPEDRPTSGELAAALAELAGVPVPTSGGPAPAGAVAGGPANPTPVWRSAVPARTTILSRSFRRRHAAHLHATTGVLRRSRAEAALVAAGLLLTTGLVWAFTGGSANKDDVVVAAAAAAGGGFGAAEHSCRVEYRTDADTGERFTAEVTVTNTGTRPVDDWSVRFDLPGDQRLVAGSSAGLEQTGRTVVSRPAAGAGLPPGGSARLEVVGTYRTANTLPTTFALNGTRCEPIVQGASTGGTGAGTAADEKGDPGGPRGDPGHNGKGNGNGKGRGKGGD